MVCDEFLMSLENRLIAELTLQVFPGEEGKLDGELITVLVAFVGGLFNFFQLYQRVFEVVRSGG